MKSLLLFLACSCWSMGAFSQNRIHSWELDKTTSIQIEIQSNEFKKEIRSFNSKQDMNTIMSYLKKVDFKNYENSTNDIRKPQGEWNYKFVFEGQRDQIYLFDEFAFIGKTTFLIDKKVNQEIEKLLNNL